MNGRPIKKYLAEIERKLSAFKMEVGALCVRTQ